MTQKCHKTTLPFLDATRKSRLLLVMPAPGTAKAVNGPLKLYLLPKPKTHPHLVISFKEPAGQGHLFLVFAPSSCTTKPIKPLLEIFLAPANQFLLIKQSKGQEGIKSETEKYFN